MANPARKQNEPNLPAATVMAWCRTRLSSFGDPAPATDPEGLNNGVAI